MKRDAIDFESNDIGRLFRKLLVPTLLGTLSMSAMTAIDGIIVGQGVGPEGVAAVNIVVPIYTLMSGIALMVGAGCSVVSSIHLAKQKLKVARLNITQALIASSLTATLICAIILLFPRQIFELLGASPTLMPHVMSYTLWLMPGFVFEMFGLIGLFIIRLDGAPRYAMWCNIIPAVLNALLDWVFVFPMGMGVEGAGIATAICMVLGGIMALGYLLVPRHKLSIVMPKFSLKSLRLSLRNIGYQCRIGVSSLMGELSLAILVYVGNLVFMSMLGDNGVAAFGISCYYTPFFFSVGNSIAQSAQPIISYNYGIERWDRVGRVRRMLLTTSFIVGAIVTLLFIFVPEWLVGLFVDVNSTAAVIAIEGFPYYATGIIFFILNVAIIGYYQSIERVGRAMFITALRGFLFIVPAFILLPQLWGAAGMWLAMPVAELVTLMVVVTMIATRKKIRG
ncbi:MAG: MATE family efflux transporter [Alistipes sp.]|nr:MATE family efflux transporter [Alistipes sp.]